MRLIARKPCRFNGTDYYIGDEVPVEAVADPIAQQKMGVLTIANIAAEDPSRIYTQEDVDQKVAEAKKDLESQVETLTGQVAEKESKITELEARVKELEQQVSPAAASANLEYATVAAKTAVKKKASSAVQKAGGA